MQQIGRNIVSLLLSRVTSGIILFFIYTRLLQYFGPEIAGQYGLIAGYLTVFTFFVDLGMQQLVIKKVSENKEEAGRYLTNYFGIQFLLGLIFMVVMDVLVLLGNYPPVVRNSLFVASTGLLAASLTMPFMAIINAYQRLSVIAKVNFVNSLINASMMTLTIVLHKGLFFISFISLAVALFDCIVYWFIVNRYFTKFRLNFDFPFWKTLFVLNLPFTLLTFFSIYNRIDTLLLPHLRNFTENGYYTAMYKIWDILAFLPGVVSASLYPFFAESLVEGRKDIVRKGLEIYTRYMIAFALPMTFGAFVLSERMTLAFFGPKFAPAAPALWILVAAVSVLFIYSPVNSLIISQRTKSAMKITGFNLFFNLALNLILIPKYGFIAAAVVTLFSECVQWIGYTYVVNKSVVDFKFLPYFAKPILAAGLMALAVFYVKDQNLVLVIAGAGILYFVLLYAMKFFRADDKQFILGLRGAAPVERDVL